MLQTLNYYFKETWRWSFNGDR